jgi:hypothetical protein
MRHELQVNRAELVEGLTNLRKAVKRTVMDAVFTYEKDKLIVFLDGVQIEAAAVGKFPGMVRIPGTKALSLSQVLPKDDPLTIAHDEQRLFIGTFSMPCTWHDVEPKPIQLPMDAPLPVLLGLPLKYSDQGVFQSGLANPLAEAIRKRKMLVTKAANALEPLGVKRGEVEKLVDEVVRQINNF